MTNVVSNFEPIGRDEHWCDRALSLRKGTWFEKTHPHPYRPLRYPSGRASGLNDQRLIVLWGKISAGGSEGEEGSYSRRHDGHLAVLHDRGSSFRVSEGTRR